MKIPVNIRDFWKSQEGKKYNFVIFSTKRKMGQEVLRKDSMYQRGLVTVITERCYRAVQGNHGTFCFSHFQGRNKKQTQDKSEHIKHSR